MVRIVILRGEGIEMSGESFQPKSGGFKVFGDEEIIEKLTNRDEILEQLKKEMGIDDPVELPITEYMEFRNELFKRYKEAGV